MEARKWLKLTYLCPNAHTPHEKKVLSRAYKTLRGEGMQLLWNHENGEIFKFSITHSCSSTPIPMHHHVCVIFNNSPLNGVACTLIVELLIALFL